MKLITKIGPMCGDAVKITNSFHGAVDLRSKDTPCHCLPWTNNSYNSDAHINKPYDEVLGAAQLIKLEIHLIV